jgi:hypothetical protein
MKKNILRKIRNKAVLFSLISLLFSALFITLFSQNLFNSNNDRIITSNVRIKVLDTYVRNFEEYSRNSLRVSSYKALDTITIYRDAGGKFFATESEFKQEFANCVTCGYIDCSTLTGDCGLNGEHLSAKIQNITNLSLEQLNINTNYTINSINISQDFPFQLEITLNITYNVSDNSGSDNYAKWDRNIIINESIAIAGLLDPQGYWNDSTDNYSRRINISYMCSWGETCWNFNTTEAFYNQTSFRYYANGTSFLQRYWNDHNSSDCCGIETIIHPEEIGDINLDNSYIDHYYWNASHICSASNNILSLTLGNGDEVHFDEIAAARYGVTSDAIVYCRP